MPLWIFFGDLIVDDKKIAKHFNLIFSVPVNILVESMRVHLYVRLVMSR